MCNFSNDGINQLNMNNFHQMIFSSRLKLEGGKKGNMAGQDERIYQSNLLNICLIK